LQDLHFGFWQFFASHPTLVVDAPLQLCIVCGLLWSNSIDLAEAKRQICTYGSAELKERTLDSQDALPRPAAAPATNDRTRPRPSAPLEPQSK
jgi:hypothetical protein